MISFIYNMRVTIINSSCFILTTCTTGIRIVNIQNVFVYHIMALFSLLENRMFRKMSICIKRSSEIVRIVTKMIAKLRVNVSACTQQTHGVGITLFGRRHDVMMSRRRPNDIATTLCAYWADERNITYSRSINTATVI